MDSYIGKLRSIFHAIGRDGEWDKRLGLGNPAADKSVKDYIRVVTAEQLRARVTPKQATPFFVDKLTQHSPFLENAWHNPLISRYNVSLSLGTRPTSKPPSSVVIALVTWAKLRWLKFGTFPMMMGFYSMMCGVRP